MEKKGSPCLYFGNEEILNLPKQSHILSKVLWKKKNRCNGRKKIKLNKNFAKLKRLKKKKSKVKPYKWRTRKPTVEQSLKKSETKDKVKKDPNRGNEEKKTSVSKEAWKQNSNVMQSRPPQVISCSTTTSFTYIELSSMKFFSLFLHTYCTPQVLVISLPLTCPEGVFLCVYRKSVSILWLE